MIMKITIYNRLHKLNKSPKLYPYDEYIINLTNRAANYELVTWMFPNKMMVQLIFHSTECAELFSMSSHLVLPYEGENGMFYNQNEIKLFLSSVKNVRED